jgi:hypothetical protein
MNLDLYIHAANLAFLSSFLVRDILKLRALSITGGGFLIAFALVSVPMSWPTLGWNLLFGLINGVQIVRLIRERRPVRLSAEEHELHRLAFAALSARDLRSLLACGCWTEAAAGERLVESGHDPGRLLVLLRGRLEVRAAGATVATLAAGQFVGEMAFVTGEPPRADVIAIEPTRLAALDTPRLRTLLAQNAELRAALQGILGADLASKLRARPQLAA